LNIPRSCFKLLLLHHQHTSPVNRFLDLGNLDRRYWRWLVLELQSVESLRLVFCEVGGNWFLFWHMKEKIVLSRYLRKVSELNFSPNQFFKGLSWVQKDSLFFSKTCIISYDIHCIWWHVHCIVMVLNALGWNLGIICFILLRRILV